MKIKKCNQTKISEEELRIILPAAIKTYLKSGGTLPNGLVAKKLDLLLERNQLTLKKIVKLIRDGENKVVEISSKCNNITQENTRKLQNLRISLN